MGATEQAARLLGEPLRYPPQGDMSSDLPTHVECVDPILRVADLSSSLRYYVEVLGFESADWVADSFTSVSLGDCGLYLCEGAQGQPGTWIWIGVGDVRALHALYEERGATIRLPPTNYAWALEMQVEDPDGHVLRFGSEPEEDAAHVECVRPAAPR